MVERFENVEREFSSLSECVEYAKRLQAKGPHLFRGERSDRYLTTPSMLERVRTDVRLPHKCREEIEKRVSRLRIFRSFSALILDSRWDSCSTMRCPRTCSTLLAPQQSLHTSQPVATSVRAASLLRFPSRSWGTPTFRI
jgi:hypothetical protein